MLLDTRYGSLIIAVAATDDPILCGLSGRSDQVTQSDQFCNGYKKVFDLHTVQ